MRYLFIVLCLAGCHAHASVQVHNSGELIQFYCPLDKVPAEQCVSQLKVMCPNGYTLLKLPPEQEDTYPIRCH